MVFELWNIHFCHHFRPNGTLEQEMEAKDHSNGVCHRKNDYHHNWIPSRKDRISQCLLPPLRVHGRSRRENVQVNRESLQQKHTTRIAGDFNAQLGLGVDSECGHVGKHAVGEPNKRAIWMQQWLIIQNNVALKKICRKILEKRVTCRSASGKG